jgi:hypothetical protein
LMRVKIYGDLDSGPYAEKFDSHGEIQKRKKNADPSPLERIRDDSPSTLPEL